MGSSLAIGTVGVRTLVATCAVALTVPLLSAAVVPGSPHQSQFLLSIAGDDLSVVSADVTHSGGQVLQTFPVAGALLVTLPDGVQPPGGAVAVPDTPMRFTSAGVPAAADLPVTTYRQSIKAPSAARGAGVTVALVDTGVADTGEVDVTHVNVSGGPQGDGYGHGTFLSGLIAGNGNASDGAYAGVAPDAKVLDVQVADQDGSTSLAKVLAGLQAVADRAAADPSLQVVNLALSTESPLPPYLDPLTRGLRRLWAEGMTVVVASGNDGAGTVSSPATDPALLAVGATDDRRTTDPADDIMGDYSSYGRAFGVMRPDVVAPGTSLVSLRAPGSIADVENPNASVGTTYFKGTGTSMSAAVTSGAVAALVGQRSGLAPNDVKRLLIGTANDSKAIRTQTGGGAGVIDVTAAGQVRLSDTPRLRYLWDQSPYSPDEADTAAWAEFGRAWDAGDLRAVVEAWSQLSPQTRRWAANAWSLSVITAGLSSDEADFLARLWAGRRWSTENWEGRRWSSDEWVGRRWSSIDWSGRRWSTDTWDSADWAGRRWSSADWLAFAWSVRNDSAEIAELWAEETWDGRRWSEAWTGRRWSGRRWSEDEWAGRRWSDDEWAGRRWSVGDWSGRRWSIGDWAGRRWSDAAWDGRRWSDASWDGRRWSSDNWSGRRWSDFAWEGRRWSTESWNGRRWSVVDW